MCSGHFLDNVADGQAFCLFKGQGVCTLCVEPMVELHKTREDLPCDLKLLVAINKLRKEMKGVCEAS